MHEAPGEVQRQRCATRRGPAGPREPPGSGRAGRGGAGGRAAGRRRTAAATGGGGGGLRTGRRIVSDVHDASARPTARPRLQPQRDATSSLNPSALFARRLASLGDAPHGHEEDDAPFGRAGGRGILRNPSCAGKRSIRTTAPPEGSAFVLAGAASNRGRIVGRAADKGRVRRRTTRRYKVALVGLGAMGQRHARVLRSSGEPLRGRGRLRPQAGGPDARRESRASAARPRR